MQRTWLDENYATLSSDREAPITPWDQELREVCADCNPWLAEHVENPAEDLIVALAKGASVRALPAEVAALSTWAVKTAYIREASDPGRRALTPAIGAHIRKHVEAPVGAIVLIGRCAPLEMPLTRSLRLVGQLGSGVIVGLSIGHVVFVIVLGNHVGFGMEHASRILTEEPLLRMLTPTWQFGARLTLGEGPRIDSEALIYRLGDFLA